LWFEARSSRRFQHRFDQFNLHRRTEPFNHIVVRSVSAAGSALDNCLRDIVAVNLLLGTAVVVAVVVVTLAFAAARLASL
jgi:hypothetical protein